MRYQADEQELSSKVDELRYERDLLRKTLAKCREEGNRFKQETSGNLMVFYIKPEWHRDYERCDAQTYHKFASGEVVEI